MYVHFTVSHALDSGLSSENSTYEASDNGSSNGDLDNYTLDSVTHFNVDDDVREQGVEYFMASDARYVHT